MSVSHRNWAGNLIYRAAAVHLPTSVREVQAIVATAGQVKALGSRHSFSALADTEGVQVSLEALPTQMEISADGQRVTVSGGVRYGELAQFLAHRGYALHNLASLPHISVAGAVATGTHGSGNRLGNLSTAVRAMELVTADGDLVRVSAETDGYRFAGMVVHLGALGVVVGLDLAIEPIYGVRQTVYDDLPLAAALENFDEISACGTSVSLFTTWQTEGIDQVWVKKRSTEASSDRADILGARRADGPRHPIRGMPTENCTQQEGVEGPWHERLAHFRMEFTPSSGEELQSEYLLPREHAASALRAVADLRAEIAPVLHVSEVRTVAADELWLSGSYGRDTVAFHFTWRADGPGVAKLLPQLEDAFRPFSARPHWGKLFVATADELEPLYPKMADFRQLRSELDPLNKFANAFLQRVI